jgi:hypothetical protein
MYRKFVAFCNLFKFCSNTTYIQACMFIPGYEHTLFSKQKNGLKLLKFLFKAFTARNIEVEFGQPVLVVKAPVLLHIFSGLPALVVGLRTRYKTLVPLSKFKLPTVKMSTSKLSTQKCSQKPNLTAKLGAYRS